MAHKRQRTGQELAELIKNITSQSFFAEKLPRELCIVFSLISRGHRESLKDAKRAVNVLHLTDIAQSASLFEEADRISSALGLPALNTKDVCSFAVKFDHVNVLERAIGVGCRFHVFELWNLALQEASMNVLVWLHDNHYSKALMWTASTCHKVAALGHLGVFQWLRSPERIHGPCPWNDRTCAEAAKNNRLPLLEWARAQEPPCPWNVAACALAAQHGHQNVLQWMRAQDPPCPWNEKVCAQAAWGDKLPTLKWLREQDPPCPWNENTCTYAARNGNLVALQWLRAQNPPCPWGPNIYKHAVVGKHLNVIKWLRAQTPPCQWDTSACEMAIDLGLIGMVEALVSMGCPLGVTVTWRAFVKREYILLKWLFPRCPINHFRMWTSALITEDIQMLKFLQKHLPENYGWGPRSCIIAAENGCISTLKWLRSREQKGGPCPWNQRVSAIAAKKQQLTTLQWLRAQNPPCPWNSQKCMMEMVMAGNLEGLKWGRSNQCEWDESISYIAVDKGHWDLVEWILTQDCPWWPLVKERAIAHFG